MAKNTLAKGGKSSYDTNVIRVNLSEAIEGRLSVVTLPTIATKDGPLLKREESYTYLKLELFYVLFYCSLA